jgi:hypothetical protein
VSVFFSSDEPTFFYKRVRLKQVLSKVGRSANFEN